MTIIVCEGLQYHDDYDDEKIIIIYLHENTACEIKFPASILWYCNDRFALPLGPIIIQIEIMLYPSTPDFIIIHRRQLRRSIAQ